MITSINTVMANSYRSSLKTSKTTAFRGTSYLLSKPVSQVQSPVAGVMKSFQQMPFLGKFFK